MTFKRAQYIGVPFVALQMSSLYWASCNTQESVSGMTVPIAAHILLQISDFSGSILDVPLEEKIKKLNQGRSSIWLSLQTMPVSLDCISEWGMLITCGGCLLNSFMKLCWAHRMLFPQDTLCFFFVCKHQQRAMAPTTDTETLWPWVNVRWGHLVLKKLFQLWNLVLPLSLFYTTRSYIIEVQHPAVF